MQPLPTEAWIAIGLIVAIAGLALLYSLALAVKLDTHIHDVKIQADKLKRQYAAQLEEFEAQGKLNETIQIVGQGPLDPMAKAA